MALTALIPNIGRTRRTLLFLHLGLVVDHDLGVSAGGRRLKEERAELLVKWFGAPAATLGFQKNILLI